MTDSGYAISADGLTKRYGALKAVDNVSLRVGRGEIYAFLGLNGAGKTTTIRMLLSMIRPSAGVAFLLGRPVHADARALWAQVGYLVETPHAYPELTVRENLEVFLLDTQVGEIDPLLNQPPRHLLGVRNGVCVGEA